MYTKPMVLEDKLGAYRGVYHEKTIDVTELYGIEVELEGKGGINKPTEIVHQLWNVVNDGSLRKLAPGDEAIEYVTRSPGDKVKTAKSLKYLFDFLSGPGKTVYNSYRTSIHVHVNCMADKIVDVCNFVTLCIIFDELLASQNGEHRIGNNFCLRSRDAEGQVIDLVNSVKNYGNIDNLNGQWRYSSINFASLCKFGTVEFRSLEGTMDLVRVLNWVRVIDNMKQASRTFENPQEIIRGFSHADSAQDFCKFILGDMAGEYLGVPGFERMLFDGMRLAQDFAFCSKWVSKKPGEKAVDKPKKNLFKAAPVDWGQIQQPQGMPAFPPPVWAQAAQPNQLQQYFAADQAMYNLDAEPVEDVEVDDDHGDFFDEDYDPDEDF